MQPANTRRDFLKHGAAVVGSGLAASFAICEQNLLHAAGKKEATVTLESMPIIDPHQHLWDLSKLKLTWLNGDDSKSLNRNFVMADYVKATDGLNVVKAVYMEVDADPAYHDAEAEYVIDICKRGDSPTVAAVISGRPNSKEFKNYISKYAKNPYIKGVRQILHAPTAERGLCNQPQFVESIQLLGDLGLCFDLCMRSGEIVDGVKLVEKCPKTRFVVDHCGNMDVQSKDSSERETWMQGMRHMAQLPNTVCKISGIIVTANKEHWKPADLAPNVNFCLDTFGEDRVFFAGDWPVCTMTASYRDWLNALKTIVRDRSPEFQRKLFHDNAAKFYGLS